MTDLYLRTTTEQALLDACPFLLDEAGHWITDTAQFSLSVIGALPPTYDEEGEMTDPGDDRFHANLRVLDPTIIDLIPDEMTIAPEPDSPVRVWA